MGSNEKLKEDFMEQKLLDLLEVPQKKREIALIYLKELIDCRIERDRCGRDPWPMPMS